MNRLPLHGTSKRIAAGLAAAVVVAGLAVGGVQAYTSPTDQPVHAGDGIFIGKFVFSPSVNMSLAYDDNILSVDKGTCAVDSNDDGTCEESVKPQSGGLLTARADFTLTLPFSHSYASLKWSPQYREYGKYEFPLNTSHKFGFETELNFANGSTIHASDDYTLGYQDSRRVTDGAPEFSSTAFVRNNPRIAYDWYIAGVWGFAGSLERIDVSYDPTDIIDFSDLAGGSGDERSGIFEFFDYTADLVDLGGYRDFARMRVYGSLGIGQTIQDKRKFNKSQQEACPDCELGRDFERIDQTAVQMRVVGQLFPSTQADLTIGWDTWRFTEQGTDDFSSISIVGSVFHRFNRRTSAYLDINRAPIQATGQVTGYYLSNDLSLGIERTITMNLSGRVGVSSRKYEYTGPSPFVFTDWGGLLELRYRPTLSARNGPVQVSLGYSPLIRDSSRDDLKYQSQRLTLRCLYGWF